MGQNQRVRIMAGSKKIMRIFQQSIDRKAIGKVMVSAACLEQLEVELELGDFLMRKSQCDLVPPTIGGMD